MSTARVRIGFKTSPQNVDWATVDAAWRRVGELAEDPATRFDSGWLNDHLTDMNADDPGSSLEALTLLATLVHHVPGMTVGHAVLSNTFRQPVLLAKAATVLDHATDGRFVLGLGAGWFEGEHEPFGIELPAVGPRIDRLVSAVDTIRALFSAEAGGRPGVTRDDPFYPLRGAVNAPPPRTPGGPPIYLGGQKARGIALAARAGSGWILPGTHAGNIPYFAAKREALVRALEEAGRDPAAFDIVGQVMTDPTAASRREAVTVARGLVDAGATHIVLGLPSMLGRTGIEALARDSLLPLREAVG
jgi:alkanesulfonate monooxygenase SsuD/methylene tetrahydromethanopterin reductase-like flavin-dependent oxidoreductase (luciferase family)